MSFFLPQIQMNKVTCNAYSSELTLDAMDDINLLCILDHLEFSDLLTVAELNPRFKQLIEDHYVLPKYRINTKLIRFAHSENYLDAEQITMSSTANIRRLLAHFGHLINRIEFSGIFFTHSEVEVISQDIARYCSKSLVEICLLDVGTYLLSDSTTTFDNMTTINLRLYQANHNNKLQLQRICPKLAKLTLAVGNTFKLPIIDEPYPNLSHLEFTEFSGFADDPYLGNLIRLNPKLQSLHLNRIPSIDLSQLFNDHLGHLQTLQVSYNPAGMIEWYAFHNESIHMKTVKHLIVDIQTDYPYIRFPMTFDHLEVLDIGLTSFHSVPIGLIQQNPHLKAVSIPLKFVTNRQAILDVIYDCHELNEITTSWSVGISAEIMRLLTELRSLYRITFFILGGEKDNLLAAVPDGWHMVNLWKDNFIYTFVTFERIVMEYD